MGDAAGELADALEPLGLCELVLQPLLLAAHAHSVGDVHRHADRAGHAPGAVVDRRAVALEHEVGDLRHHAAGLAR